MRCGVGKGHPEQCGQKWLHANKKHEEEGQAFLIGGGGGGAAQREFDNPMERLRSASSGTRKMCDTSLNNRLSNLF